MQPVPTKRQISLCGSQLAADDGEHFLEDIALRLTLPREQFAYAIPDAVQHGFELRNHLGGARGIVGQFYGTASQFGKQPDIAGGYQIGALNAFVACLDLETQQRMNDFG